MNRRFFCSVILILFFSFVFSGCVFVSKKIEENPPIKPEPIGKETKIETEKDDGKKVAVGKDVETKKEETENEFDLSDDFPLELVFESGAGAWGTYIYINEDGNFTGNFHDSEMGSTGENYEHGTVYICDFNGKFSDIKKIDSYTYSMTLVELNSTSDEEGTEWIDDNIKYISSVPYGLEEGKDFLLYVPETPLDNLNEEFLSWWPYRFETEDERPSVLKVYGLYNVKTGYGFFSQTY